MFSRRFKFLAALVGGVFGALIPLSVASATDLHDAHVNADSTTFKQECSGDEGLTGGQVLWHFVLVQNINGPADLTATFQDAGTLTVPPAKVVGGVVHWNVITPGNDVLLSATSEANGRLLNLSHVCGGRVTENPKGTIVVQKFFDQNGNGVMDGPDYLLPGWKIAVADSSGASFDTQTTYNDSLYADTYAVTEYPSITGIWTHSYTYVNGASVGPINPAYVNILPNETGTVDFGNYCTVGSGGLTLGYWSNKNGGNEITQKALLSGVLALPLVKADGSRLGVVSLAAFQKFLTSASATNMANMLSAQLAASWLDRASGRMAGSSWVIGYDGTVSQLIAEASAALAADSKTLSGDVNRAGQERLKNYLDHLNNGGVVIPSSPAACGGWSF